MILRAVPAIHFQRFGNVASGATVVKIALGRFEMTMNELFVPALQQNVEARLTIIDFNESMSSARTGHPHFQEQFARQRLRQVTRILHRIVQADLLQSMKPLAGRKLAEVERDRRLLVDVLVSEGTLQV